MTFYYLVLIHFHLKNCRIHEKNIFWFQSSERTVFWSRPWKGSMKVSSFLEWRKKCLNKHICLCLGTIWIGMMLWHCFSKLMVLRENESVLMSTRITANFTDIWQEPSCFTGFSHSTLIMFVEYLIISLLNIFYVLLRQFGSLLSGTWLADWVEVEVTYVCETTLYQFYFNCQPWTVLLAR